MERAKLYHKLAESHTIYDNVNPQINVLFVLGARYSKRLIFFFNFINPSFQTPTSNKRHLAEGVAFIENIPITVTVGEIREN